MIYKKFIAFVVCSCFALASKGQDSTEIIQEVRKWMQEKSYDTAVSILKNAIAVNDDVLSFKKELFWCYYYQDKDTQALEVILPLLQSDKKDEQCFQLCGYAYQAIGQVPKSDSVLKIGLKLFPSSGPLYSDLGESYQRQKKNESISYWETGIRLDPNFAANYYHAALYYLTNGNPYRGLLYGEIFVNFSPTGEKSITLRKKMLEVSKTIFTGIKGVQASEFTTAFGKKFITHFYKQDDLSKRSLNLDDLLMLRARFLLDWFHDQTSVLPFRLYQKQRDMLQQGLFVAYHQWLFGSVENPAAYEQWKLLHTDEQKAFELFQLKNSFSISPNQYYF